MADDKDYLESRIKEETAKVKVDSYQQVASIGGWSGGGRTLWAIAVIGVIAGAMVGAVAPLFPMLVGAAMPSLGTIGTSIAAFAATGLSMGFAGGIMMGRISGAAASVAQEQERRMKEWMIRQKMTENPGTRILPDSPQEKPPVKSLWNRAGDGYHTYINPRVGLVMAAIGVLGGLLMGGAFILTDAANFAIMPAMETLTGLTAEGALTKGAIVAYTAGVSGTIGALWSFNLPKITSALTHFFGELISGKPLGREWGPKPEKTKEPVQEQTMLVEREIPAETLGKPRVHVRRFASYTEMVAHQAVQPEEPLVKR